MKPIKPGNMSPIMKPIKVNTKIFSSATEKRVENRKIEVSSLVPRPAKVMGRKLATFTIGNSIRKER
jgi:hypothetical protein